MITDEDLNKLAVILAGAPCGMTDEEVREIVESEYNNELDEEAQELYNLLVAEDNK